MKSRAEKIVSDRSDRAFGLLRDLLRTHRITIITASLSKLEWEC